MTVYNRKEVYVFGMKVILYTCPKKFLSPKPKNTNLKNKGYGN